MEFILRCNDLKCRTQLHDRAVVTTCSHIFCTQCTDTTGLSRASNANRTCPACGTHLASPHDVAVADLNPSEDYKTSVLSGLSPTVINECMSRGLSFYTYQSSQEIIYQEHLAKNLADNFAGLNQQMDQLIHDANAQIKLLQDKLQAIHVDQTSLEQKNHELVDVLREKSRAHQQAQKLYQSLKAQVMASQVVTAASDAADLTLHSARGDRYVGRIPGVQTMAGNFSQPGMNEHMARKGRHERNESVSSGSVGQRRGGIGVGPAWSSQLQSHGLGNRAYSGHQLGAGNGASQSQPRSRLPVLGSTRANPFPATETGNGYQGSPMTRLPVGISPRPVGGYALGAKSKSTGAYLGR